MIFTVSDVYCSQLPHLNCFFGVGEPKATGFANGPVSPKAMKEEVYKCSCRSLQKATIWGFENSFAQWLNEVNQKLDVRPKFHGFLLLQNLQLQRQSALE